MLAIALAGRASRATRETLRRGSGANLAMRLVMRSIRRLVEDGEAIRVCWRSLERSAR
jgi:hypothetical protein